MQYIIIFGALGLGVAAYFLGKKKKTGNCPNITSITATSGTGEI